MRYALTPGLFMEHIMLVVADSSQLGCQQLPVHGAGCGQAQHHLQSRDFEIYMVLQCCV